MDRISHAFLKEVAWFADFKRYWYGYGETSCKTASCKKQQVEKNILIDYHGLAGGGLAAADEIPAHVRHCAGV